MQTPSPVGAVATNRGPRRPPLLGTAGVVIPVNTNHFKMRLLDSAWHHYDVTITPTTLSRRARESLVDKMQAASILFNPRGVYDSRKNFYIRAECGVEANHSFTVGESTVQIKRLTTARLTSLRPHTERQEGMVPEGHVALQLLNIIAIQAAKMTSVVTIGQGRTTAYDLRQSAGLGGGLLVARGFVQSVRPGWGTLYVNIDMTVGVMHQPGRFLVQCQDFLRMVASKARLSSLDEPTRRKLSTQFRGVKVHALHLKVPKGRPRKVLTIKGISPKNAAQYVFTRDGVETNVQEYFQNHYQIRLEHPMNPCVLIGDNAFPMEVLEVLPGQLLNKTKKIAPEQTQGVLKHATLRPHLRLEAIRSSLNQVLSFDTSDYLKNNAIEINPQAENLKARVLPTPGILYGGDSVVKPANGAWNMSKNLVVSPGGPIVKWCILNFTPNTFSQDQAKRLADELYSVLRARGLGVRSPCGYELAGPVVNEPQIQARLDRIGLELKASHDELLIICAMEKNATPFKTAVKRWGDVQRGVVTQIVDSAKVGSLTHFNAAPNPLNQYCNNLVLKINAKFGGINCAPAANSIPFLTFPTIIMGADVAHPSPGAAGPSTVALVSSVNPACSFFRAQVAVQEARQEMIEDLAGMVKNTIGFLREHNNGKIPPRLQVLFYRDGISEGQFAQALEKEATAIEEGLAAAGYGPGTVRLTFIVVGKKHQFRMFPVQRNDADRSGNCPSGTIVEINVTNPWWNDFYLQSQAGLIGTSRPAHYSVLRDDNNLTADQLQNISFALCHFYSRATRTVSIPSVVYYADLVCSRGAYHYPQNPEPSEWSADMQDHPLSYYKERFQPVHPTTQKRMYWM